jgi:transcriptional regulator
MYTPAYYRKESVEEVVSFIRKNPFGIVVSQGEGAPIGSHIPFELMEDAEGKMVLQGHISRANPQWKNFEKNPEVLVIFNGPHAYVSSGWYNHINVPTWNYIAVHVTGSLKIIGEEELYRSLKTLVDRYEQGSAKPVVLENLPQEMINKYLKGIVGFNISINKLEGKWKLSQNRDEDDFKNIISHLENLNDINSKLVAEEMRKL